MDQQAQPQQPQQPQQPPHIQRALNLVEAQRRASRSYYMNHKPDILERNKEYRLRNKDALNARRRASYHLRKPRNFEELR